MVKCPWSQEWESTAIPLVQVCCLQMMVSEARKWRVPPLSLVCYPECWPWGRIFYTAFTTPQSPRPSSWELIGSAFQRILRPLLFFQLKTPRQSNPLCFTQGSFLFVSRSGRLPGRARGIQGPRGRPDFSPQKAQTPGKPMKIYSQRPSGKEKCPYGLFRVSRQMRICLNTFSRPWARGHSWANSSRSAKLAEC